MAMLQRKCLLFKPWLFEIKKYEIIYVIAEYELLEHSRHMQAVSFLGWSRMSN